MNYTVAVKFTGVMNRHIMADNQDELDEALEELVDNLDLSDDELGFVEMGDIFVYDEEGTLIQEI